ncbi:hypothetical protein ABK040_009407 [Willaertia magna]
MFKLNIIPKTIKNLNKFNIVIKNNYQLRCYSTAAVINPTDLNVKPTNPIKLYKVNNESVTTNDLFGPGEKVVVFGLPGAFTPVCSSKHVPSFIKNIKQLKEKGVNKIVCVSVNDSFVMKAWREKIAAEAGEDIEFIADPTGEFTRQLGLEVDLTGVGLGKRSKRYSMLIDDGKVKQIFVEESPGQLEKATAENMLTYL